MTLRAAENRPTFHASLQIASEVAASDDALVMLVFGAPWCPYCKRLNETTLASTHFFDNGGPLRIVRVDIDADPTTARAFKVLTLPTLHLLTADGKVVARRSGYLDDTALLAWLKEGRERAERGQWEGWTAEAKSPPAEPGEVPHTKGFEALIGQLADPNPTTRSRAASALLEGRDKAMPFVIEALRDSYLGTRIAASEVLNKLALDHAIIDPWRSAPELGPEVDALKKWWEETLILPAVDPVLDQAERASVRSALDAVRAGGGVARTEGMTTLLARGRSALPSVREAIEQADREDQPRVVALLEEVRWAILISDNLERECGGVRRALARGTSAERQAAATRLAQAGAGAIEPLNELVNDNDPLVVEAAVGTLSTVGGAAAVPALAVLLRANDANLRMVAAQALGRGKEKAATPHLLAVLSDENEVVACTALTAIEEVHGTGAVYGQTPQSLNPQTVQGLQRALEDPRWRVRATAAEVAGKVQARELAGALQRLLDDSDGFVVKNSMVALSSLGEKPDAARLLALARRLPSLRADAIQTLAAAPSPEAVRGVMALYSETEGAERVGILTALAPKTQYERATVSDAWEPLLARAAAEKDPQTRRTAAELLGSCSSNMVVQMVGDLVDDEDEPTRAAAADALLGVLTGQSSRVVSDPIARSLSRLRGLTQRGQAAGSGISDETKSLWRSKLVRHAEGNVDPRVALAIYVLGDAQADLPFLMGATSELTSEQAAWLSATAAVTPMLGKLPWPEGAPLLQQLYRSPILAARLASESNKGASEAGKFLREPTRLKSSLEPAMGEVLDGALNRLLTAYGGTWSLLSTDEDAREVRAALYLSTNAGWRAAALFAMSKDQPERHLAMFEQGLEDPNPLVRREAVRGLRVAVSGRDLLEERLGPLVGEAEPVGSMAALALLEPEVLQQAGLIHVVTQFRYGGAHAYTSSTEEDGKILVPVSSKPAFLEVARARLQEAKPTAFAMLLAQYGDFSGLDRLVELHGREPDHAVFAAIALSRDPKYVPFLGREAGKMTSDYELKAILQALRLMEGPEARALRIDINRRSRQMSSY